MIQRLVLAAALLLAAPRALAGSNANWFDPNDTGVKASPLSGSPSATIRTEGYGALTLYMSLTRSAATALNVTCTAGPTPSVQATIGVATVSGSGAITLAPASWSIPVSGSGVSRIVVGPLNDRFASCTFGGTAATSSDLLSLYAVAGGRP